MFWSNASTTSVTVVPVDGVVRPEPAAARPAGRDGRGHVDGGGRVDDRRLVSSPAPPRRARGCGRASRRRPRPPRPPTGPARTCRRDQLADLVPHRRQARVARVQVGEAGEAHVARARDLELDRHAQRRQREVGVQPAGDRPIEVAAGIRSGARSPPGPRRPATSSGRPRTGGCTGGRSWRRARPPSAGGRSRRRAPVCFQAASRAGNTASTVVVEAAREEGVDARAEQQEHGVPVAAADGPVGPEVRLRRRR